MWRIRRLNDHQCVVLRVSGRIEARDLEKFQEALALEGTACERVELDLGQMRLVDQTAVEFFARKETDGMWLRNCPRHIREWIKREEDARSPDGGACLTCGPDELAGNIQRFSPWRSASASARGPLLAANLMFQGKAQ